MKSYLSARFLYVVANGIASDTMEFFCGVPQGAIWSPKFWNFHMRELPSCLLHAESFNYADDSAILKVFGHSCATWSTDHFSRQTMDRHNAMCELNADLSRLIDFGVKWKVQFEPTKTRLLRSGCPFQSVCQINPRIWELGISSSCPRVSTKI